MLNAIAVLFTNWKKERPPKMEQHHSGNIQNALKSVSLRTVNLELALKQIRHETEQVVVWTDQICINQNSKEDKTRQIRLMGSTYSKATSVIIWLGLEDCQSSVAFNLINEVRLQIVKHGTFPVDLKNPRGARIPLVLSEADRPEWVAFRRLFTRPWFGRVWTFEEVVLAQQAYICCGKFSISWQDLFTVCYLIAAWDMQRPGDQSHLRGEDKKMLS